jgi:hypothetical protein
MESRSSPSIGRRSTLLRSSTLNGRCQLIFAPALRTLNEARKKAVYEGEEPDLGDQSLEDLAIDIDLAVDLAERGAS